MAWLLWIWLSLDLEALVQSYLERSMDEDTGSPMWVCRQCGKTSAKLGNIRDHIEANHIDGPRRVCQICMRSFKSSASLRMHKIRYHKDWKLSVTSECTWREFKQYESSSYKNYFHCLEAGSLKFCQNFCLRNRECCGVLHEKSWQRARLSLAVYTVWKNWQEKEQHKGAHWGKPYSGTPDWVSYLSKNFQV